MENDYGYVLPYLLSGYFWFQLNGLWDIPWFTPAFCGGIPYFPHPTTPYYSVPQFLTFVLSPVAAVRATMLIFAALGYAGFYVLMRRTFSTGMWAALLGAALFMFNGFYAHRMLIGHLDQHAFMLAPIVAFLLLPASGKETASRRGAHLLPIVAAGCLFAYMFHSGLVHVIPVVVTAVIAMAVMLALAKHWPAATWAIFGLRFAGAAAVALALSATKLTAGLYYLQQFPRDFYPLPGLDGFWETIRVAFLSLFIGPPVDPAWAWPPNWIGLGRHEFEYGVTFVPLELIVFWAVLAAPGWWRTRGSSVLARRRLWLIAGLLALLALPLLLNWYSPWWHATLKELPFFRNSSTLIRWYALFIPLAILGAAIALDRLVQLGRFQSWIAVGGMVAVVVLNGAADRRYYADQLFSPAAIQDAHEKVRTGLMTPRIDHIADLVDEQGRRRGVHGGNDALAWGGSQMYCYEAMFGYRLEAFPFASLHPGPVDEVRGGTLNIKNPACFIYPAENDCRPGDHYPAARRNEAEAFTGYRPIPFAMPFTQRVANWINLAAVGGVPIMLVLGGWFAATGRRRAKEVGDA